jgi:manganese transport protein
MSDPYALRPEEVAAPPVGLWRSLLRLGPGVVLAASIVGSGELIATTTLGAQVGYAALWIILLVVAAADWSRVAGGRGPVLRFPVGLG